MKPFDRCVMVESAIEVARFASDQEIMISIILSTFYTRFFSGRTHELRGDT